MKIIFWFLFLLSLATSQSLYRFFNDCHIAIFWIKFYLNGNPPISNSERSFVLFQFFNYCSEALLKLALERLVTEDVLNGPDPPKVEITLDFSFLRLEQHQDLLDELINYGFLDVKEVMLRSSKCQNFNLFFFFISRGADINYKK